MRATPLTRYQRLARERGLNSRFRSGWNFSALNALARCLGWLVSGPIRAGFHAFHYNSRIDSEFCDIFGGEMLDVTTPFRARNSTRINYLACVISNLATCTDATPQRNLNGTVVGTRVSSTNWASAGRAETNEVHVRRFNEMAFTFPQKDGFPGWG